MDVGATADLTRSVGGDTSFLTKLGARLPSLPQGVVDFAQGFGEGAASVYEGAFRFGQAANTAFSSNPVDQFQHNNNQRIIGTAIDLVANNSAVRSEAIGAVNDHFQQAPAFNSGFLAGRVIVGALTIVGGPIAIVGDTVNAANNGQVRAADLIIQGVFGQ